MGAAGVAEERVIRYRLNLSARSTQRPEDLRPDYLKEMRGPLPVIKAERASRTS